MKSLLLLLAFLLFSKLLTAQEEDNDRNWGLGASFQGTQLDITILFGLRKHPYSRQL